MLLLSASVKIEKERKQLAKEHGMIRTELTGAEVSVCLTKRLNV